MNVETTTMNKRRVLRLPTDARCCRSSSSSPNVFDRWNERSSPSYSAAGSESPRNKKSVRFATDACGGPLCQFHEISLDHTQDRDHKIKNDQEGDLECTIRPRCDEDESQFSTKMEKSQLHMIDSPSLLDWLRMVATEETKCSTPWDAPSLVGYKQSRTLDV